jgi:hypothetical protein
MDEEKDKELAGLRDLALRLLSPFGHDVSADRRAQLLVGQLPVNLPIPLPLPADAHIVGSIVGERRTDIFFDTKEPLEAVQRLYSEQMTALGWQDTNVSAQAMALDRGGFVLFRRRETVVSPRLVATPVSHHLHEVFFDNDSGSSLTVTAAQPQGQVTPVQVTFQTYEHPEQAPFRHRLPDIFGMLPPLSAPEGSSQHSGGGSAGGTEVWNTATLITDLDVKAVGDHYNAQLIEGGWTLVETGYVANDGAEVGKRAAWSYWRFTDDENRTWYGSFAVLCHPETPRDYALVIQAHRPAESLGNSFGVSGASSMYFGAIKPDG